MPKPPGSWSDHDEDGGAYPVLDPGFYLCELIDIHDDKPTRKGDEMWRLRFEINEGPHEGTLIFDNLVFAGKGWDKAKLLAHRLGGIKLLDDQEITQEMLLHKKCWCNVIVKEFQGKKSNGITFDGFESVEDYKKSDNKKEETDDIPF